MPGGNISHLACEIFHFYQKGIIVLDKQETSTKSIIIPFRVTPEEKALLEEKSYGHYRLMSDYIRDCVFKKEIIIINGLDEFADELRRIGNNLNQLTRAVNSGYAQVIDLDETRKEVKKLWQSLNSLAQIAR